MLQFPTISVSLRRVIGVLAVAATMSMLPSVVIADNPVNEIKELLKADPKLDPLLPLEKKQQELQKFHNDREAKIGKIIDTQLKSFSDLRQTLMLKDWGDSVNSPHVDALRTAADTRLRSRVAQKFRTKVRAVIEHGDDDSKAAVANLITELGLTVRAAIDPDKPGKDAEAERRAGFARSLTDEVIQLTGAKSPFVRLHALRALGGSNPDPKRAAAVFATTLASTTDVQARRVAADGLLRLVTIAEYLKGQELNASTSAVWASGLDVLSAANAVVQKAPAGLDDGDPIVRARCAEALRASAQALAGLFQRTSQSKGGGLGERQFTREEINGIKDLLKAFHDAGSRIAAGLVDPAADVRLALSQALERVGDARYRLRDEAVIEFGKLPKSIKLLPDNASDPLANFAAGDWRVVARLLDDPDVRVRRAAINFLEFFGEARPGAVPDLAHALSDVDRFVRWSATRALSNFSDKYQPADAAPAVPALAKLLFDNDLTVRLAAAATLESLGIYAQAATGDLARAVHFGDVENRVAVIRTLQAIGPDRSKLAIPSLTEALANSDARVRRVAAETLGKYGDIARNTATIDALRRALGDDDQEVRINASEALLQILAP